jgi:hypothetical protein
MRNRSCHARRGGPGAAPLGRSRPQHPKKPGRLKPVSYAFWAASGEEPQVGAGPNELIQFRQRDPRPLVVETKPLLDRLRDFQRIARVVRRAVRNRQHLDALPARLRAVPRME